MEAGPEPGLILPNRLIVGQRLAERVRGLRLTNPIVLAIPPGGAPVGFEMSRALGAGFDIIVASKVSVPENPQRALGAVAEFGASVTSERRLDQTEHLRGDLGPEFDRAMRLVVRRARVLRQERDPPSLAGRDVILVTDGVVEPLIVRAALRGVASQAPQRIIFATGVIPRVCMVEVHKDVGEVVTLREPQVLFSVSEWYGEFPPVADSEIQKMLNPPETSR